MGSGRIRMACVSCNMLILGALIRFLDIDDSSWIMYN